MSILYFRRKVNKFFKRSRFIFCLWEWISGDLFEIWRLREKYHKIAVKSNSQIINEKKMVRHYWKCGTYHYEKYGLAYKELDNEAILDYVPTYYHHIKLERDHKDVDIVHYGNKLNQAMLFAERGIPNAGILASIHNRCWSDCNGNMLDCTSLIEQYFASHSGKLFIKNSDGQGGYDIFVVKKLCDKLYVNNKEINKISEVNNILPAHGNFIVQEGVVQTEQFMRINSSSLNTLRVVTQLENGRMVLKTCIIRMGRNGREVDNSAQGGISAKVNLQDGQVAYSATAEHGGGCFYAHPDTGIMFCDIRINNWSILRSEIEVVANKLAEFRNIALDIAVTDDGVKLIEFNFHYGIEHQQCVLGGVRRILGIDRK